MAKDFVKLSEATMLEEVNDTASVFVEMDGEIYRAPKTQVGGANVGGIKTAIIQDSGYLGSVLDSVNPSPVAALEISYECINMTYEEIFEAFANGEPIAVLGMFSNNWGGDTPAIMYGGITYENGDFILHFTMQTYTDSTIHLRWTSDGIEEYGYAT